MKEFISGVIKSPSDGRDLLVSSFLGHGELPKEISYRNEITHIRNQGSEGSCTGHAACYLKEFQEQRDYSKFIALSPRFAYEESKKISGSTEGSSMKATAQALISKGICEDRFWPYIAGKVGTPESIAYKNAEKYKCQSKYVRVTNIDELKKALAQYGPVMVGVLVYKNWYRQKNGHIPNPSFWDKLQGVLGGHAITISGYSDITKEFEFPNSWDKTWGDNGFGYITYKHMSQIIMDAYAMIDIDDSLPYEFKTAGHLHWWERIFKWL